MTKLLFVLTMFIALSSPALAQNQGNGVLQTGSVTPGHAAAWRNNGVIGDAGGSSGSSILNSGYLTALGITATGTPFCINDALINAAGGYHQFCLGANALGGGLISYNAVGGATPLALTFNINGTNYPFPGTTGGGGNVVGPNSTSLNEIASFNNTVGTLLREGAAQATDNKTGAITTTGASLAGVTSSAVSADQILAYTFCTSSACLPLPSSGAGNYDGVRGVGISNASTTTPIVAGVSGYVLSDQAFVGAGPSSVALFGTGAVNVDGGAVWGINTNVSDHQYRTASGVAATVRRITGAEFDVSASYTNTDITGILIAGNSVVQPTNSTAISVVGQDFSAGTPGSIAKWSQALFTFDGVATHFALIGTATPTATATGNSQDILWGARISGTGYQGSLTFGSGFTAASAVSPSFLFNYPIQTMTGGAIFRSTTDQLVQVGGATDLASGATIEARNDLANAFEPLEFQGAYFYFNGPVRLQPYIVSTLPVCSATITGSMAVVTDATAPTYNGALTGSGTVHVPVSCDGSAWSSH